MTTKAKTRESFIRAAAEARRINAERVEVARLDRQLEAQSQEQLGRLQAHAEHLGYESLEAALTTITEEELAQVEATESVNGSG